MKQEILLLKIHKGYELERNYYDAIRGNWKVSAKRFNHIKYVVGVDRGRIVCAFKPSKWSVIENGQDKGRKSFEGMEVPYTVFSNFEEILLSKFGRGNPVAYAYLSEIE